MAWGLRLLSKIATQSYLALSPRLSDIYINKHAAGFHKGDLADNALPGKPGRELPGELLLPFLLPALQAVFVLNC
jgi:hypothetical protein